MQDFTAHLESSGEYGYVEQVIHSLAYVSGLPNVQPNEIIMFEDNTFGQVLSLGESLTEILVFSKVAPVVGSKVTRTQRMLEIPVGTELLGRTVDALGNFRSAAFTKRAKNMRAVEVTPLGIARRKRINQPLYTGVAIVDLLIPLGLGQRQLIIGDRKTGKSSFLLQVMLAQVLEGTICIYTAIGKESIDIKKTEEFFEQNGIKDKSVIVASTSQDGPGPLFLAPYSAMTIAEYFRDQGRNVLLVLDDLSTHAKVYREIALLGKRFPGRNSYPADIFYIHARLLERAGNFVSGNRESSISCLPVVETIQGDLTGYIQTNLMSMTDGHVFFDSDLFAQGRRPAINPFLSVTRVGKQTQNSVKRDISREIITLLTLHERTQRFIHFGAEASESIKNTLANTEKLIHFFDQSKKIINPDLQVFLFTLLWAGVWQDLEISEMRVAMEKVALAYEKNETFRKQVLAILASVRSFNELLGRVRKNVDQFRKAIE